jgi:hypothetical protein
LTVGGKWLAALKEIAPSVTRAAVIINPDNPAAGGFLGVIEASSSSLGVRVSPLSCALLWTRRFASWSARSRRSLVSRMAG